MALTTRERVTLRSALIPSREGIAALWERDLPRNSAWVTVQISIRKSGMGSTNVHSQKQMYRVKQLLGEQLNLRNGVTYAMITELNKLPETCRID